MSKLRMGVMVVILALISFSPLLVNAAGASFFGPIVSERCKCPGSAPGWGCILQTLQNLMNLGISISVIVATIIIAYAGFLWILSPTNAENKKKGRDMLLNAVIGMVIVLSAWLVIDFVMKALYDSKSFGPWNEILTGQTDAGYCLVSKTGNQALINNSNGTVTTCTNNASTGTGSTKTGGNWSYDPGIQAQMSTASPELASLLSCMRGKLPQGVGKISSISDSAIINGTATFSQCAVSGLSAGCHHGEHACHFGGNPANGKVGQSYAVDFGDEQDAVALRQAAGQCNSDARYFFEGDHVHISLGHYVNAGCDMNMALAGAGINASTSTGSGQTCTTTTSTTSTTGVTTNTTNTTPVTPATSTPATEVLVTATFGVSPTTVTSGTKSTLTWSSTNATSCVGTGFDTGNKTSGTASVTPTTTTNYSVTCTGTTGSKKAAATVTVAATSDKATWDPQAASDYIRAHAINDAPIAQCARAVRLALAAGGLTWLNANHPNYAYQYAGALGTLINSNVGFQSIFSGTATLDLNDFPAQQGDVVVFQPTCRNVATSDAETDSVLKQEDIDCRKARPNAPTGPGCNIAPYGSCMLKSHSGGHIAMYDGIQWSSIWLQDHIWSYYDYVVAGGHADIYRHP